MTRKSHLVLILLIAIREPRETKKTNLWISLGHKSIKRNNANCQQRRVQSVARRGLKGLAGFSAALLWLWVTTSCLG